MNKMFLLGADRKTYVVENLPPSPEPGGTAPVNADWNAAPGESGHVLNRTHYAESSIAELLPETTIVIDPEAGQGMIFGPILDLEVGHEYTVIWNGTEYKCVAKRIVLESVAIGLGNMDLINGTGDTGEPFVFLALTAEDAAAPGMSGGVIALDGSESATVSISEVGETVHKLDAKYLNQMIVNVVEDDSGLHFVDKSYTKIRAHFEAGGQAFLRLAYDDGGIINLPLIYTDSSTLQFCCVYHHSGRNTLNYAIVHPSGLAENYTLSLM